MPISQGEARELAKAYTAAWNTGSPEAVSNTSRQYLRSPNARRLWKTLRTQGSDPRFIAEIDAMVAGIDAEEAANASALEKASKEPA